MFLGLAKILKKYDKRTGGLLRLPFIQKALQQSFFTTNLVSKLVKECESTIDAVFPAVKEEGGVHEREQETITVKEFSGTQLQHYWHCRRKLHLQSLLSASSHFAILWSHSVHTEKKKNWLNDLYWCWSVYLYKEVWDLFLQVRNQLTIF